MMTLPQEMLRGMSPRLTHAFVSEFGDLLGCDFGHRHAPGRHGGQLAILAMVRLDWSSRSLQPKHLERPIPQRSPHVQPHKAAASPDWDALR